MNKRLLILFLCISLSLLCQGQGDTRSVSIKPSDVERPKGITRALIVGVSQYQQIHGLQYADRDAEEFSNYLLTNPNWKLPKENLVLLTNDKAKSGSIITWLNWLLDNSKEGDNVVFYFSGHGDVETVADASKGFLLSYDCPKNNYITGALGVDILQNTFSEMLNKGIKVYIVTDACRSGHLAGGAAGTKQTAQAFSKQWKNETKILSSQPDEVSFEGPQWGNGRGVFSFFLMKGLNGFADLNRDSTITLSELEQYVGLQVSEATKYKQQPIFEGASKFSSKLSKADTAGMNRYRQWDGGTDVSVYVLKEKGKLFSSLDSSLAPYPSLKQLMADSAVTEPLIKTALNEYLLFKKKIKEEQLREHVRYSITASLMNYLQQLLNQSLIGKKLVDKHMQLYALTVVEAIQNINKEHRLINAAHLDNIRRYFFINSISLWNNIETINKHQQQLFTMLDSAFATEPNAAYLLNTKAVVYMNEGLYDSAAVYLKKAIAGSPTWLMPKYFLGQLMELQGKIKDALGYYEQIMLMDSTYQTFECTKCFYIQMGTMYMHLKKYKDAEHVYLKAFDMDSSSFEIMEGLFDVAVAMKNKSKMNVWLNRIKATTKTTSDKLNLLQLLMTNKLIGLTESAQQVNALEKDVETKEEEFLFHYTQGLRKEVFKLTGAIDEYEEAYNIDPYDFDCLSTLLRMHIERGHFNVAEDMIDSSLLRFKGWRLQMVKYYQAIAFTYNKKEAEAIKIFMELIEQDITDCKEVKKMKPLQQSVDYKLLLEYCK
jgi:tetratricopeptide (TPR) repeat protein